MKYINYPVADPDGRPAPVGVRVLPCGDSALTVEFGDVIDPALNERVRALDDLVNTGELPILGTIPTYRSLLIEYDGTLIAYAQISSSILALCTTLSKVLKPGRNWEVPVAYGGTFGADLAALADRHGMTAEELIRRHSNCQYLVYMIGFVPGFTYLGGLDPALATPRLPTPRRKVPAGSIAIGGEQTAIASVEAPSGWHQIGRTPVRAFASTRDPVCLFAPGDTVSFLPISEDSWLSLAQAAHSGQTVARQIA